MKKIDFDKYLKDRYEKQIKWYSSKSTINKRIYMFYQWGIILFSSLTPVLILLEKVDIIIPALISVLIAIFSSALNAFKYHENWLEYRTTSETLKKEKYFYDAGVFEYKEVVDKEAFFVERVENLISRENTKWLEISKSMKKEK